MSLSEGKATGSYYLPHDKAARRKNRQARVTTRFWLASWEQFLKPSSQTAGHDCFSRLP